MASLCYGSKLSRIRAGLIQKSSACKSSTDFHGTGSEIVFLFWCEESTRSSPYQNIKISGGGSAVAQGRGIKPALRHQ